MRHLRPVHYDEAFITSIVPYQEADCIVRLFAKEQGRMVLFFKNGMAFKKKQGTIQALAFARIGYSLHNSEGLKRLSSLDMDPSSFMLASSLRHFAYGNYVAELLEKLLPQEEPAAPVFSLLRDTMDAIFEHGPKASILRAFELKMLFYLGFLPELPEPLEHRVFYDPIECTFSFESCEHAVMFPKEALVLAKDMLYSPIGAVMCNDESSLLIIGRIFFNRLQLMNLLPLKSVAFFKEL